MKKLSYLMAALLVAMTGCQKEPQQNEGLSSEDTVYMKFSIQTLTTRSATDNNAAEGNNPSNSDAAPDYEVGFNEENTITSVDVVLRNATTFAVANVTNPTEVSGSNKTEWIAEFSSSKLTAGDDYDVYIYANCTAKQDLDATSDAGIDQMTAENKFWMTSAYGPTKVTDLVLSTNSDSPTDLGACYVERAMARFDYMPINGGIYTLADGMTVTLTDAALINQSKEFYLLRRVSDNGTNTNWTVGGAETPMNYVVDTDYAAKNDGYNESLVNNFDAHLTLPANWTWKSIKPDDLVKADNWNGTDDGTTGLNPNPTHELNDYYVWQYAKENTIPGVEIQENGISTGVVFKGELTGDIVTNASGAPIYVFDGKLYGTWTQVVAAAAETSAPEALKFAVANCNNSGTPKDAETLAANGFKGFSAVDGKYYTYYYYWNRHFDNADNKGMGQMEFAVVRNNVYKLCVDTITGYGHPTPGGSDPDPDPVDPTDPDESGEYYFKVTAKVLPWVVRVNHIGF